MAIIEDICVYISMHIDNAFARKDFVSMMKIALFSISLLFAMLPVSAQTDSAGATARKIKVFVIPVEGTVEPGMAAFLGRAVRDARSEPDALLVFEMDSFGGGVEAAFQIVDTLLGVPKEKSISYVKTKAISAGALIALACGKLVMQHNTTIGDCAPISIGQEGPQMLGEKFQSPLRAKFRTLAKRNGFPEALAESMVSSDRAVFQVTMGDSMFYLDSAAIADLSAQGKKIGAKKQIVARGQLLTMDDVEAQRLGFSRMSVGSIDQMLDSLGIKNREIVRIQENWSETFVRYLTAIAPILMMIGFALLYLEFKTPGFGVFGIAGILVLALVFLGQYMVGLANYTELLLILIGVALIMVEVFVTPGMFILGIAGVAFIGVGLMLSLQNFVVPSPEAPWQAGQLTKNALKVLGSIVAAGVVSFLLFKYALPRLGMVVKGPYLSATLETSHADSEEIKSIAVGDAGTALTLLRPAGKARFGRDLHDVVSEGGFIEKGSPIVVREVSRSKIVVARKKDA